MKKHKHAIPQLIQQFRFPFVFDENENWKIGGAASACRLRKSNDRTTGRMHYTLIKVAHIAHTSYTYS